jgi:hypothetical protein
VPRLILVDRGLRALIFKVGDIRLVIVRDMHERSPAKRAILGSSATTSATGWPLNRTRSL